MEWLQASRWVHWSGASPSPPPKCSRSGLFLSSGFASSVYHSSAAQRLTWQWCIAFTPTKMLQVRLTRGEVSFLSAQLLIRAAAGHVWLCCPGHSGKEVGLCTNTVQFPMDELVWRIVLVLTKMLQSGLLPNHPTVKGLFTSSCRGDEVVDSLLCTSYSEAVSGSRDLDRPRPEAEGHSEVA